VERSTRVLTFRRFANFDALLIGRYCVLSLGLVTAEFAGGLLEAFGLTLVRLLLFHVP